ncbi:MAG: nuclease [Desulfovibrio desulfuricans]|jgi:endonuclease YncB( thermonuclease family)|nr:nuclease [Desulfovibrio desulfuricans]
MLNILRLALLPVICALLCLPACASRTAFAAAELPGGVVALCFDGDTVKLTDRRVVRVAGIDTPELRQGKEKPQYYAREALEEATRLARGKEVRLMVVNNDQEKDRYGRLVADVILPDGRSLSDVMVSSGAAYVYPHKGLDEHFTERLRKLQNEAVIARRGMWGHILSMPAARRTYMGNRQSLRFFAADSPYVQNIKPRNRVVFGTLMDAFTAGYAPARPCPFWPTVQ